MVRLNIDLISKTSSHGRKKRDETLQHYLKRLTHLYFAEKGIDEIEDLSQCRSLSVLYLYDNNISRIQNVGCASNLTHLYLQNNQICKIEQLSCLRKLSKLYLGANQITVVEGFEKLDQLKELHIENQRLAPGEKLLFDPRSLVALSACLQVLNVSGNNLDDIKDLQLLKNLSQFMACDNSLRDMKVLSMVIGSWRHLWRLELTGNPLSRRSKYRDRVIVMSDSLAILDGKEINDTERNFLMKWKKAKDAKKKQRIESQSRANIGDGEAADLPPLQLPNAPVYRHNVYVMPGLLSHKKEFEAILARSASSHSGSAGTLRGQSATTIPTQTPFRPSPPRKSYSDLEKPPRKYPKVFAGSRNTSAKDRERILDKPTTEVELNTSGHMLAT
ncbi:protein phosphatase 1 regulatory subunit 42-like [Saccoglossus kowalevskii]|uniref:Protein phosphatase 1 regulatory subunit 42-like isoform X1 n=1 Tax=Saccoglossus kowalevskii TaxID=10224 RepID=A0ABM0GN50_SACKO|nr:PREDICTED: protein phosphatase 1 regulatory subunit 42-like isoform X1 [Saccoglossus kowalevskii]XP_006815067.1 PREDICTED: protein phosphatase 1 regulatory subunit 42-like isoform X2 [Saccoglossus kowalevskii]